MVYAIPFSILFLVNKSINTIAITDQNHPQRHRQKHAPYPFQHQHQRASACANAGATTKQVLKLYFMEKSGIYCRIFLWIFILLFCEKNTNKNIFSLFYVKTKNLSLFAEHFFHNIFTFEKISDCFSLTFSKNNERR